MPRTGARPGGSSYASGSESESAKRLLNRLGRSSSSSLESAKRLLKALPLAGADAFSFVCLPSVVGFGNGGTGGSSFAFLRNRPPGDKDLILNLDDFTGSGEDGRIDWRMLDCGALGGDIDRTWVGTGAEALRVGPAAGPLIEVLEKPPPPARRARLRWKLLADASESLS